MFKCCADSVCGGQFDLCDHVDGLVERQTSVLQHSTNVKHSTSQVSLRSRSALMSNALLLEFRAQLL